MSAIVVVRSCTIRCFAEIPFLNNLPYPAQKMLSRYCHLQFCLLTVVCLAYCPDTARAILWTSKNTARLNCTSATLALYAMKSGGDHSAIGPIRNGFAWLTPMYRKGRVEGPVGECQIGRIDTRDK